MTKTEQVVHVIEETITRRVEGVSNILNWKILLSEFVSTLLLMFFGCMSCMPLTNEVIPPLYGALGFGLTVGILVQSFGHLSGAHMNPSVTLAAWIMGKIATLTAIAYVAIQIVAAILGYGLLIGLTTDDFTGKKICCTLPYPGQFFHTIGIEFFLTSGLILVCCSLWDPVNKNNQESVSIKFGFAIAGLSIVGGPLTGASMNPARSLAPAVWTGEFNGHWYYWVGPLLGSGVTALLYRFVWLEIEEDKQKIGQE